MKVLIKIGILLMLVSFFLAPYTSQASVVINEVAWMGTEDSASDEWIELYSDQEADLSGWSLESVDGSPIIALEGVISSNSYFLLERTDDETIPNVEASQIYSGALNNTGEHLILKNTSGVIIDEVNQSDGWLAGDNSTKQTMERINADWQISSSSGGTPKTINSKGGTPSEEVSAIEKIIKKQAPKNLSNSENQPPVARAGRNLTAFIDEGILFDGSQSYDPDGKDLAYEWNLGEGGVLNDIVVRHKYSYPGTYLATLMVFDGRYYGKETITIDVYSKKIMINEFMPNPIGNDSGNKEGPGEWIELYNDSNQIIDISNWQLDDEEGGSTPFVFPANTLIRPKGYLLLSRSVTKIALNNDKDKVRLLLSDGTIFQEISYEKAVEGKSSARVSEDFNWSIPTPGLPNIVVSEDNSFSGRSPLHVQATKQAPKNTKNAIIHSTSISNLSTNNDEAKKESSSYYNLADLSKTVNNDNNPLLTILIVVSLLSIIGIGLLKFKKKL